MINNDAPGDVDQLLMKIRENEQIIARLKYELEKEKTNSARIVQITNEYKSALLSIAVKMSSELNSEESILRRYEILMRKQERLQRKYDALQKSPLTRFIYLSWNLYNKIRYNKQPRSWNE